MASNDPAPVAVVTGASQGIGYETARALAARGFDLAVVARSRDRLSAAAERIAAETGAQVEPLAYDLAEQSQVRGRIALDDLSLERGYGRLRAYDQSKLALLLFTFELARRVDPGTVCVNAVEPGWVRTAQTRQLGPYWLFNLLGRAMQTSPEQGARSSVRAADLRGVTGQFLSAAGGYNRIVEDRSLAGRLWDVSEGLVGLSPAVAA